MNESTTDRIIRAILGGILMALAIWGISGFWTWVAGIIGGVLLITGLTGFCAMYKLLGMSTNKPQKHA